MKTNEKIRLIREINKLSQEDMAEKLSMSAGGYAKIERGETHLALSRLKQIAEILHIDVNKLADDEQGMILIIGDSNNHYGQIQFGCSSENRLENEYLKAKIQDLQIIIEQKDRELAALQEIIALLKLKNQ